MFYSTVVACAHHGYDIEAYIQVYLFAFNIRLGSQYKIVHFRGSDSIGSIAKVIGAARFHLDKDKHIAFLCHDIQFFVSATPIKFMYGIALLLQITHGKHFALTPKKIMFSHKQQ